MRRVKKILYLLFVVCMLCPCMSMIVHAASAELRFSDPSTTVGAEVEVAIKIYSSADIETLNVTLAYDKDKLRFISGDNATGGDGSIALTGVLKYAEVPGAFGRNRQCHSISVLGNGF